MVCLPHTTTMSETQERVTAMCDAWMQHGPYGFAAEFSDFKDDEELKLLICRYVLNEQQLEREKEEHADRVMRMEAAADQMFRAMTCLALK